MKIILCEYFGHFRGNQELREIEKKNDLVGTKSTTLYREIRAHAFPCKYKVLFLSSHRNSTWSRRYITNLSHCVRRRWPWKRLEFIELRAKIVCVFLFRFFFFSKQTFEAASRLYYYIRRALRTFLLFHFLFLFCFANVRNSCLSTILHTFVTRFFARLTSAGRCSFGMRYDVVSEFTNRK